MKHWNELDFWKSGEFQVVKERLTDLDVSKTSWNPGWVNLFRALKETPYDTVRVIWVGQDPYPNQLDACGLAFSVPVHREIPPTLRTIFGEYVRDLQLDPPANGDLLPWAAQGVLLWNAVPSCLSGRSLSHYTWTEWHYLTREILQKVGSDTVFVFSGSVAREFSRCVAESAPIILTSHPSPRAGLTARYPFVGSKVFTRINAELVKLGKTPIDWRLGGNDVQSPANQGSTKDKNSPSPVKTGTGEDLSTVQWLGGKSGTCSSPDGGADGGGGD